MIKKVVFGLLVLGILACCHMRFGCTGVYGKELVMYTDTQGRDTEQVECQYVGWDDFTFTLFTPWFTTESAL